MRISRHRLELSLLSGSLFFAFLYFVLRALVWDHFIWILIAPSIGFVYAAAVGPRFFLHRANALDKVIIWYLVYGVLITVIVVLVLGYGKAIGIKYFVHYYAPAVMFFVARRFTRSSAANIAKLTVLFWILAGGFIVDVSIEYYVAEVQGKPLSIPWKLRQVEAVPGYSFEFWQRVEEGSIGAPEVWIRQSFGRVQSIMKGRKATGMVAVVLFAFMAPYYYVTRRSRDGDSIGHRWRFKSIANLAILAALIWVAYVAGNKVAMGSGIVVLGGGLLLTRSRKLMGTLVVMGLLGLLVFNGIVSNMLSFAFVSTPYDLGFGETQTPFQRTTDIGPVLRAYANTPIDVMFFGHYQLGGKAVEFGPTREGLLGLSYPARFGLVWGIIVIAGVAITLRYALTLIMDRRFLVLGLACLGVIVVYVMDLHDPSSIRHGPFELAFMLAAILSSAHEIVLEQVPKLDPSRESVAPTGRTWATGSSV